MVGGGMQVDSFSRRVVRCEAADLRVGAFERGCAAVGCVPAALVARVEAGFGLEDERAAREEEGFVTDES